MNTNHWILGFMTGAGFATMVPAFIYNAELPLLIGFLMGIIGFILTIKFILEGKQ